jgi:tetratricopeptide (TPR) repeat protein
MISCSTDSSICKLYLQKKYIDANLIHEKLFDEGKVQEAILNVESLIQKDSNNYIALSYLGSYLFEQYKQKEGSLETLKQCYNLNKKSVTLCEDFRVGYHNLIEVLSQLQNTKYQNDTEIIHYLEYYNSRFKKKSNLLVAGGQAMFRLGKINESIKYLNEAVELDSLNSMAFLFIGKCYSSQKKWDKAMMAVQSSLELDSTSLGFHERGMILKELGKVDEAIVDFNTAISLYEDRWESYVALGSIEVDNNNIQSACNYFRKAKELNGSKEVVDVWINTYCK